MNNPITILVTGAGGQLGREIKHLTSKFPLCKFIFADREVLPIDDFNTVHQFFLQHKIDFCINCAAYTAVDKAETEARQAFKINGDSAGNLGKECADNKVKLIHISTDYVYGNGYSSPINEKQPTAPINIYGQSKLKGEEAVLTNDKDAVIIRTSWLYSSFGHNFLKTMVRLMGSREEIKVVNDQFGTPTYARHLANVILDVVEKISAGDTIKGVFNYANSGMTTWFHFAKKIKEEIKSSCNIIPISTAEYPTPAQRPKYSALSTDKIRKVLNSDIPAWEKGVEECIKMVNS